MTNKNMTYLVKIKPSGYRFRVNQGETILDAAIRQEFYFPHSCRYGVCGTCKGKLLAGEVDYAGVEIFGLEPDEIDQGYILCCSAQPTSDVEIEVDEVRGPEAIPEQTLVYTINQCQEVDGQVYLISMQPKENDHLQYRAGQYLEVLHVNGHASPFSIANSPYSGDYLELHIRHSENNPDTTDILKQIKENNALEVRGPFGHCIFHKETKLPIIFLAEGTGFSPIKALIEEQLTAGFNTPMHLYWYGRSEDDLYLADLAERWAKHVRNFKFSPVIDASLMQAVAADYADLSGYQVYAAGSEKMVLDAFDWCKESKINPEYFYSDWVADRD